MDLRHLRCLLAIVDQRFSLTRAAAQLHLTQPAISKQLALLERELGLRVLERAGKRLVGLSAPGLAVADEARRILQQVSDLGSIGEARRGEPKGELVIATTHVYARYVLVDPVIAFRAAYPQVRLLLRQADPERVAQWVAAGDADIGICADPNPVDPSLERHAAYSIGRILVARRGHPILAERRLSLRAIARHPVIGFEQRYAGGVGLVSAFERAGLAPEIVIQATDADVVKAYVARGVGIAVLPSVAFDAAVDSELEARDASRWFAPVVASVVVRRGRYLRRFVHDFLALAAPQVMLER